MNDTATPTVSVVIPTFNRGALLEQAIRSVLAQTYRDLELLIVDDGSTDTTRARVATFQRDDRVKYLFQRNRGRSAARNAGIRAARGRYVALLDDDDFWSPEKLERQMARLQDDAVDVVHCDFRVVDGGGQLLATGYERPPSRGSLYEDLMYGNVITGSLSAALVRSRCFDQVGVFDERLSAYEDQDLFRRMALANHTFSYVNEVLVFIRWHEANTQSDPASMAKSRMLYLDKLRAEAPPRFRHHLPEVAYDIYRHSAFALLGASRAAEAAPFAFRIAKLGPKYIARFAPRMFWFFWEAVMRRLSRLKRRVFAGRVSAPPIK